MEHVYVEGADTGATTTWVSNSTFLSLNYHMGII